MTATNSDPLGDVTLHWLYEHSQELCDCPAQEREGMRHATYCGITPAYFETCVNLGSPHDITRDILAANMQQTQTVIRCAECGRENVGREMLVIYQAPLVSDMTGTRSDYKYMYPHNIVKAVCPHHNRNGTVGYQRTIGNGYGA